MKAKRFLLYTFVYIVATLSAVFGTLGVNALIKHGQADITQNGATNQNVPKEEPSDGEKLLNGITSLEKTKVNFTFDILSDKSTKAMSTSLVETNAQNAITINFDGNLSINGLEDIKLDGNLLVNMPNNDISISIAYLDNMLYLSTESMDIKFSTKSIGKIVEILPTLGLNLDLGFDMSSIDTNALLDSLMSLKAVEQENGELLMPFTIMEGLALDIYVDKDYVLKRVVANEIALGNITGALRANLTPDNSINIASPDDEKEFVDVTKTLNVIDSLKELITNKKAHFDFDARLSGNKQISFAGGLDIDLNAELNAYTDFTLNLNGTQHNLCVGYVGEDLYLAFNSIKLRLTKTDLIGLVDTIQSQLGDVNLDESLLTVLASVLPNLDFKTILQNGIKSIGINNLLQFAKGDDNVVKITILGKGLGIANNINVSIKLDELDQFESLEIEGLKIKNYTFDLTLAYRAQTTIPQLDKNEFAHLTNLDKFAKALITSAKHILQDKQLSFKLQTEVELQGITADLEANINVNFANTNNLHIYVDAKLKAFNKTIFVTISVDNGTIYLAVDNLVFTTSISEIEDLKSALSGKLGNALNVVNNLKYRFGLISDILNGKIETIPVNLINYITSGENVFSIGIDKALLATTDDLSITFGFDNSITDLTIGNVELLGSKISADIHILDEIVEKDFSQTSAIPIANLDKFINAVSASVTAFGQGEMTFGINADLVVNGTTISIVGSVMIDNGVIYANVEATAFDKTFDIEAYIINKIVYITIDDLKLSIPISKAVDLLKYQFDIDFDVDKFVRSLVPSFDIHSIIAGDLSSLSLDTIKDISFGENETIITLNSGVLATDQDVIVEIDYTTNVHSIKIKNLSIHGTDIATELSLQSGANIPTFIDDYSDLSSTNEFINALKSTISSLKDSKQITLNLNANATISGKAIGVAGKVYINANKIPNEFNLSDLILYADVEVTLEGKEIAIIVRLENGCVYVEYGGLKIKIACNSIKDLIDTIKSITSTNIDLSKFNDLISDSIVSEMLAGDFSHLGLTLIKNLSLTDSELSITFAKALFGTTNDININLGYRNRISTITIADLAVDDYQLAFTASLDYYYQPEKLIDDDYQDISGINKAINSLLNSVDKIKTDKEIAISISNTAISLNGKTYRAYGNIYADFSKVQDLLDIESNVGIKALSGYIHLNLTSEVNDSHDITIFYKDERIYLTYNTLNVCLGVNELDSIVDVIMQLNFLSKSLKTQDISNISMKDLIAESKDKVLAQKINVNISELISQLMPAIDLDAIKSGDFSSINLSWLKQLEITDSMAKVELAKEMFNSDQDLSFTLNYNDFISGITIDSYSLMGVDLSAKIELLDSFVAPKIFDESIYCNLDALREVVDSTLNTAIEVVDNKHIAFGINTDIVHTALETDAKNIPTKATVTTIHMLDGSNARFEWTDAYELVDNVNKFNIKKMRAYIHFEVTTVTEKFAYTNGLREAMPYSSVTNNHSIEITFIDNVLYIRYNQMYAKIGGDSIDQLIRSVCDLLNIDLSEIDLAKLMEMLNGFNFEGILAKFKVEMIEKLSITSSNISLIMNIADLELGINTIDTLKLDVEYNTNSLTSLVVKDLKISNIQIDSVSVALQEFEPITAAPNAEYIDLSGIENLIDALSNTTKYKDFQIDGTVNLQIDVIGINIDWNIPLSVSAKIVDGGYEVYARLGTIPVITGVNNDVPFKTGNTGTSKNRILNIYIKDDFVYLHRTETIPAAITDRVYEKKVKVHIESLMSDPLYYILQYGLGLSDKIMEEIYKSLNIDRQNPIDYSNVLVGFTATSDSYVLTLNLKELTENENLDTMSLGIKTTALNDKRVIDTILFDMYMPVASGVTISLATDDLHLSGLGSVIDMTHVDNYTTDYSYKEGAFWDAYDGDWQLSSQRKFSLNFETNSSQKLDSIVGIAGSKVDIPTLDSYFTDDEIVRTTYTFAGWYTTATFDVGTEYTDNIMPRKDTTLYAKWSVQEQKYVTISFVTNGGSAIAPMKLLEGSKLDLHTYLDLLTITTDESIITKQFDGWCVDEECTQMFDSATAPNFDITLYAKWSVVDSVEAYTVSIFDDGEKILTRRILSGNYIQLTGAKFKDSTKYYLDANYSTEISLNNFVMPENDVNIYIRNKYKIHITSQYGNVIDSELEIYQGEKVDIVAQNSYYYDDGNEIERIDYIFNGYYNGENIIDDIENFVMPNQDLSITANWTVKVRQYVTISFKVDFVKPATWEADKKIGSKWFIRTECRQTATQPASFKVLEGTELVMSNYTSSCEYAYTGAFITKSYKFKLHTWSVEGPRQLSYNKLATQPDTEACDVLESFVVTEDTTFYAVWAYAG